jgi:hypothetical protein
MTTKKEALKKIEEKVEAAKVLIEEAEKIASENKIPFMVGLIRERSDADEDSDQEEGYYGDGYITTEAGWSPSGLNC